MFTFFSSPLFSDSYTFGGKKGWSEVTTRNGITSGKGRFGNESLELETNAAELTDDTDLLLNFEDSSFLDKTGNYSVVENSLYITKKAKIGKEAAFSRNRHDGLILSGKDGSLFGTEGPAGSFLIEFWICPSAVENGEVILNWRSSRNASGDILYKHITVSVYQNALMCTFGNIFEGYSENQGSAILYGKQKLVPEKWSHHSISFEENSGALMYKADGMLEDIKFITDTGRENGSVFQAVMGMKANLEICSKYTGLIDDIKISRSYESISEQIAAEENNILKNRKYRISGGRFETEPIFVKSQSVVNSVTADVYKPSETEILLYVRGGDNYFTWTENYPEWIPVKSGEHIENLSGLYFQIAAELYPSGDGKKTPSITELALNYIKLPEPNPPYRISAEAGNGSVTLKWTYSVDDTTGGYYIYYGNAPGEYLGRFANEGASPINVGNRAEYTITGLENGTIYYFAISAFSKFDSRVTGHLSKEVFARPTK